MRITVAQKVQEIRTAVRTGEPTEFLVRELRNMKASGQPMTPDAIELLRSNLPMGARPGQSMTQYSG